MLSSFFISLLSLLPTQSLAADENSFPLVSGTSYSNYVGSQVLLYQQPFANSWNVPVSAHYAPSVSGFNRVVLELQVNTTGANYDRLGQLFVDDIEIWRTSTPEPDSNGVTWTVRKDVSPYGNLFTAEHEISLLIENRVTSSLTGTFYATLTAHFYHEPQTQASFDDSWAIDLNDLPNNVQALSKTPNNPSVSWSAPGDEISVSIGPLDRSVSRAVLHVFASGNGDDEFWWDSAHQSNSAGPSRFIDAYVGNELAGFAAPYPVIYSGGITPYLWKPMLDLRALDVPAYFIDITPFLPKLWAGNTPISLNITNGVDAEPIPSNWIVNYNLLTWSTPGESNSGSTDTPQFSTTNSGQNEGGAGIVVSRKLETSATLNIGGKQQSISWKQDVAFNNTLQSQGSGGNYVWQATQGSSSVSGLYSFDDVYSYPFQCEMVDSKQYRVQQSYDVTANSQGYTNWIDSSASLDGNGNLQSSQAKQYVSGPDGSHFAEANGLQLSIKW